MTPAPGLPCLSSSPPLTPSTLSPPLSCSPVERMVMERSGCSDVHKVRQCLREMEGDSESAIEVLKAELREAEVEESRAQSEVKGKGDVEEQGKVEEVKAEVQEDAKRAKEEAKRAKAAMSAKERRLALKAEREKAKVDRARERKVERMRAKEAAVTVASSGGQLRVDGELAQDFGSLSI